MYWYQGREVAVLGPRLAVETGYSRFKSLSAQLGDIRRDPPKEKHGIICGSLRQKNDEAT
jgi:hypothetical protein